MCRTFDDILKVYTEYIVKGSHSGMRPAVLAFQITKSIWSFELDIYEVPQVKELSMVDRMTAVQAVLVYHVFR